MWKYNDVMFVGFLVLIDFLFSSFVSIFCLVPCIRLRLMSALQF